MLDRVMSYGRGAISDPPTSSHLADKAACTVLHSAMKTRLNAAMVPVYVVS